MSLDLSRLLSACTLACCTTLTAQVPDGWYVVASLKTTELPTTAAPFAGNGGLFLVDPHQGIVSTITGLPPELVGAGTVGFGNGANCVTYDRRDGSLWVGQLISNQNLGPPIHLFQIYLNGKAVDPVRTKRFLIGTNNRPGGGSIDDIVIRSDGHVVFNPNGVGGVFGSAQLATMDTSGVIAALPLSPPLPLDPNALAIDASGTLLFVGIWHNPTQGSVYSMSAAGGTPTLLATNLQGGVMSMDVMTDGRLLVGTMGKLGAGEPENLYIVDPASKTATPVPAGGPNVRNALVYEQATGSQILLETNFTPPWNGITVRTAAGAQTLLTMGLPGGWGLVTGIDLNPNPKVYGRASPTTANSFTWDIAPVPGGLPQTGTRMGLPVVAKPGQGLVGPAVFFVAPARADTPILPNLYLQVGGTPIVPLTVDWRFNSIDWRATLWLTVPPNASLLQVPLRWQAFAVDGAGLGATAGLEFSLQR